MINKIHKGILFLSAAILGFSQVQAEQVIWTEYKANPNRHPKLPNCSYSGYRNGEVDLPNPSGPIIDVKTHGAKGDGATDDTAAIRAALQSVGSSGGVVYFPDGTYVCSGPLFVHQNNTILRGQSRVNTKIRFTKSLASGYGSNTTSTGSSRWSWSGGLIWFTPQSKNSYTPKLGTSFNEEWNIGSELTSITSSNVRGDTTLTVSSASSLSPGQFVFVRVTNVSDFSVLKHLCGGDTWGNSYPYGSHAKVIPPTTPHINWLVQISSVSGNTVVLKQPLRFDLRSSWSPKIVAVGSTIRESGVENLSVVLARNYDWSFSTNHNKEPGWNGPWFNNAINCFMRNVTIIDADMGAGVSATKNITFKDISIEHSGASGRLDHHHGTTCRVWSQDFLLDGFKITSQPWHGVSQEWFSMGTVFSKGTMSFGTFDTHRVIPYEAIRTEITINNSGDQGGASDAGPRYGARFAHWNVNVTNNRNSGIGNAAEMPNGAIVGVRGCSIDGTVHSTYGDSKCHREANGSVPDPINLYLAQKTLRLGAGNPPPTVSITSPANGSTYAAPASITINASAADSNGTVSKVEFFAGSTPLGTDSSSPYSVAWNTVASGIYSLTAKATDNGGASTTSTQVTVSVNGVGGAISASKVAQPASLSLSTEGSSDWGHWGLSNVSDWNHKSGITAQISNVTVLGSSTSARYTDGTMSVNWSGGTPTASSSGTTTGLFVPGVGNGFQITAPADATERTLKVHCGVWKSQGRLEVTLSDNSAPMVVDTTHGSTTGSANTSFAITYKAGTAGQNLRVKWTVGTSHDSAGNGTVGFQAATLSTGTVVDPCSGNTGPTVSLTSPAAGSTYTAPATVAMAANASDAGGSVSKVDFLSGSTLLGTDASSPYALSWSNVAAGMYSLSARATDSCGATATSTAVSITVNSTSTTTTTPPSGSLSAIKGTQPATLSLNTEGSRDWSHWGLNSSTDWNHKSGVTSQITNITKVGTGTVNRYTDGTMAVSWTGGTPTTSASSTRAGIFVAGVNNGFQITVPADTTSRTLRVYCGVWKSQGKLEATLSDGSAPAIVDTTHGSTTGSSNITFSINYKAASAGHSLTVKWTVQTSHDTAGAGTVGWQTATLQ